MNDTIQRGESQLGIENLQNFGYVIENGVNSNEKAEERIVARMCFVVYN